jgi:hypothetical protein
VVKSTPRLKKLSRKEIALPDGRYLIAYGRAMTVVNDA